MHCTIDRLDAAPAELPAGLAGDYGVYHRVVLATPAPLGGVRFRNFYSEVVSLSARLAGDDGGGQGDWVRCLRDHRLMARPHFEDDAQDAHCVEVGAFAAEFRNRRGAAVAELVFCARQSSPMWRRFQLDDIECFPPPADEAPAAPTVKSTPLRRSAAAAASDAPTMATAALQGAQALHEYQELRRAGERGGAGDPVTLLA